MSKIKLVKVIIILQYAILIDTSMKLGASFSDSIHTEKRSRIRSSFDSSSFSMRAYIFPLLLAIVGLVLFGRLFFLQVLAGQYYRNLSDNNRIRTQIIHAPRGVIFDRNGKPLVYNVPGYRETVDGKTVLLSKDDALKKIAAGDKHLEVDSLRNYPLFDSAAHVIGYIGQISKEELKLPDFLAYQSGELIGKMGVEEEYESSLKGLDGKVLYEVDAVGKPIRILGQTDPIPGQNITLTLDSDLQKAAYNTMKDVVKGSAIVSTPTGDILALVSKPSFDPNLFTMGKHYEPPGDSTYKSIEQVLLDGTGQPLLDRAIAGTYPPGSTFKIVTAAAGLETHAIDASYTVDDTGILKIGNFSFANWYYTEYGKTEGEVNVVTALKRSNDIFFYKVGNLLGVDSLSSEARKFGLGAITGIPLPGEAKGLVPTKEWKKKVIGEQWYLGDDYHYGIGQGYLLTTPIQVNVWTQIIANGGTLYKPNILKNQNPQVRSQGLVTDKNRQLILQGMIEACSPGGVAFPFFNFSVKNPKLQIDGKNILAVDGKADERQVVVACKTGTAQTGSETTNSHAWITLFAPAYKPQVVVTVLVENGGEGSTVAGPIAKDILTSWFGR